MFVTWLLHTRVTQVPQLDEQDLDDISAADAKLTYAEARAARQQQQQLQQHPWHQMDISPQPQPSPPLSPQVQQQQQQLGVAACRPAGAGTVKRSSVSIASRATSRAAYSRSPTMKSRPATGAGAAGGDCSPALLTAVDQDEGEAAAGQPGSGGWDPETTVAAAEALISKVKGWMEEQEMKALEVRPWPAVQ
jgi:hypothetical protein